MNPETSVNEPATEILSESDISYQYASTGQRFLNFLIDNIFMRFGLSILTGIVVGIVFQALNPDLLARMVTEGTTEYWVFVLVVGYVNYVLYYTLCEKLFNGYTLGKLITGTKAVRLDGSPLTFKNAFLRSLSRLVPFEALSGFGTPWHDSWTDTTVIKTR
jgi:uncharacterized RDD family membrane protein YckC